MLKTLASNKKEDSNDGENSQNDLSFDGKLSLKDVHDYESQLSLLRQVVDKEPKRVAQVVKTWVDRG
jgi:flagellar M-ring protein FliF